MTFVSCVLQGDLSTERFDHLAANFQPIFCFGSLVVFTESLKSQLARRNFSYSANYSASPKGPLLVSNAQQ